MSASAGRVLGRYAIFDAIAAGGMATVHLGRLVGEAGFARTVAIKRLHAHLATDPEFAGMFLDEARVAARIRHPNVVPTLDVVSADAELYVVLEYVHGESLARLLRATRETGARARRGVVSSIMAGVLHGLHAAHEATTDRGEPLGLVHRDVSPQNILVGLDGIARVLDFGVAKAADRVQTTQQGRIKGKLGYMAPEQARAGAVSRRSDVYAAGVVLWECLTGSRLFAGENEAVVLDRVFTAFVAPPGTLVPDLPEAIDAVVMRALERDPARRFATAREMALALERAIPPSTQSEVGDWVEATAGQALAQRAARIAEMERPSPPDDAGETSRPASAAEPAAAPDGPPAADALTLASGVAVAASGGAVTGPRARSRSLLVASVAVALGVGAAGLLGGRWLARREPSASSSTASLASVAPPASTSQPTDAPVASPPASVEPSAAPVPSAARRAPSTAPHPARPPRPPSPPCVPYTVAPDGTRVYNRQCL